MKERNALIVELRLADIRCKTLSKLQWKKAVSKAIIEKNRADLLDNIARNYKKLDFKNYQQKSLRLRKYIKKNKIEDSRIIVQSKSKMMRTVKMNYKNNPKYIQANWTCSGCSLVDIMEHLLWCDSYSHLRVGLNLDNDNDLAGYYRNILKIRVED